jgi:hypothetical protein
MHMSITHSVCEDETIHPGRGYPVPFFCQIAANLTNRHFATMILTKLVSLRLINTAVRFDVSEVDKYC